MKTFKELEGKEVIVRAHMAGVFFGTVKELSDKIVVLKNCRKLFY